MRETVPVVPVSVIAPTVSVPCVGGWGKATLAMPLPEGSSKARVKARGVFSLVATDAR